MLRTSLNQTPARGRASALLAVLCLAFAPLVAAAQEPAPPLLIRDVQVLDLSGRTPDRQPHASVLVRDGLIVQVGAADEVRGPAGARVIEGGGRTLMAGLVDMHVHLWDEAELGAYLARGITTVRNASGMPFHLEMRDRVAAGDLAGPRVITTGPILNSPGPNQQINHQLVSTPDEARAAVRQQYAAGFRRLKVYSNLTRPCYDAIREEAARLGMTIMGHTPEGARGAGVPRERPFDMAFDELLDDGFVTIEHVESIVWHGLRDKLDEDEVRALAKRIAASGVPVDPTLLAYYSLLRTAETGGEYLRRPGVEYLNAFISSAETANFERWSNEDADAARRYFAFYKRATKVLQDEGVLLVTGTDAGIFTNIPGQSLATELRLLAEAGLTPFEALQAATWNAARTLGEADRAGRIAPGFRADLILVDGDPLGDPALATQPHAVIAAGRVYDRSDLDTLLKSAANPPADRTQRNVMAGLAAQAN